MKRYRKELLLLLSVCLSLLFITHCVSSPETPPIDSSDGKIQSRELQKTDGGSKATEKDPGSNERMESQKQDGAVVEQSQRTDTDRTQVDKDENTDQASHNDAVVDQDRENDRVTDQSHGNETLMDQDPKTEVYNVDGKGVAVKGYDVVAYFRLRSPVRGTPTFSVQWSGAIWFFSTQQHQKLFLASPQTYAPQYGGYCAWAVSQGYTADIDPQAWKVVNQKLYLNFSLSVQKQWEQDIPKYIALADKNWPSLRPKP